MDRLVYTDASRRTYFISCAINGVFSLMAIVGNSFILNAIRNTPSLHTPSYLLLFFLAVSDLAVGLTVQPLFIIFKFAEIKRELSFYCEVATTYMCLGNSFACFSFLTMVLISVDRFLAVRLRLKYRTFATVRRVKVAVVFSVILALLSALLYLLQLEMFYSYSAILVVLCLSIASVSYFRAIRLLKCHQARLISQVQPVAPQQLRHNSFSVQRSHQKPNDTQQQSSEIGNGLVRKARSASFSKSVKSMLFVYGVFVLCYTPYVCSMVLLRVVGRTAWLHKLDNIGQTIVMLNSSLNPLLYYWRIRDIRLAVRKSLGLGNEAAWTDPEITSTNK